MFMNNRTLLKYHSWFGLIVGFFLIIMGISGSILVFHEQIDHQFFKEQFQEKYPQDINFDVAVQTIQNKYPGWDTRISQFQKGKVLTFDLRNQNKRRYVFVHPKTGEILKDVNSNTHFTSWLLKLHYSLHANVIGRITIFFVGILFFLSLISGIILYRKHLFKAIFFKIKIKTKNRRVFYSTLHRYIGTWALLLNLVLVITGIILAYGVAMAGLNPKSPPNTPRISASITKGIEKIESDLPKFKPTYLRLPLAPNSNITVYGNFKGDFVLYRSFFNRIELDPKTGEIVSVEKISEAPILTKLNSTVSTLHYAEYGGWSIKILYCLIGLSGPLLSITGFILWWKRKLR